MLRSRAIWLVLASIAIASSASATAPSRVRLSVVRASGAESCPAVDAIARAVTERLGWNPFDPNAERFVDVVLSRTPRGFGARIYARETPNGPAGERTIAGDARDCEQLADGVVLAVALAIDPDAPATPRAPSSPPPASPAPASSPPPSPTPSSAPPPAVVTQTLYVQVRREWSVAPRIGARAGIALGLLPNVAPAIALTMDTPRLGPWSLTFGAMYLPETTSDEEAYGFALTAFWLGPCGSFARGPLWAGACAEIMAGALHGDARTGIPGEVGEYPWLALALDLRAALRVAGPLAVEASVAPVVPVLRYRFSAPSGTVFAQDVAGLLATLGVSVNFP